ncbi:MAG: hypothetical protein P8Y65_00390 [Campylobacterales bacterium]
MRIIQTVLLPLLLFYLPFCAAAEASKEPAAALPLLEPLKRDAIEIGEGAKDAYVFVDPKCLKSADFLDAIRENATLRKQFHYYIFLYDMPQAPSEEVINAVYTAASPKEAMFTYMLEHKRLSKETNETPAAAQERIRRIKKAAEQIGIDKTPYLIVNKSTVK